MPQVVFVWRQTGENFGWYLGCLDRLPIERRQPNRCLYDRLVIVTCNAVLLYFILGRVIARPAAFVGSVTYLLLPVDLSKQILMLRGYLHFSMLFLLLALVLYGGGTARRKVVSYVMAALSLVTWEAFYLPFVVAPLLEVKPIRDKLRNFLIHVAIFPVPIVVRLLIRYLAGEQRVSEMAGGGFEMVLKMLAGMVIGPSTAAAAFFWRPLETFHYADSSAKVAGFLARSFSLSRS